jgi:peptide/nickel transport system permease protein
MIADGEGQLASAWWISTFPAAMIALTVLAFNLLGDWASDTFNPRLKF